MKTALYLRVASLLTFLHAALHIIGGVFGKPAPGLGAVAYAAMRANHFHVLGVSRTYWNFYFGMSVGIAISLTAGGFLLWLLGSLAGAHAAELRPILWVFVIYFLALAWNSAVYLFIGPVIGELLIAACLFAALATAKPATA